MATPLLTVSGACVVAMGLLVGHRRRDVVDLVAGTIVAAAVAVVAIDRTVGWSAYPTAIVVGGAFGSLVVIDLREHRLPRLISQVGALVVTPFALLGSGDASGKWEPLAAAAISTGLAGVLVLVSRGALGRGDLHLAPLLGLTVTGGRVVGVVPMWLAATLAAGLFAAIAVVSRRLNRDRHIPFGPFLLIGWIVGGL